MQFDADPENALRGRYMSSAWLAGPADCRQETAEDEEQKRMQDLCCFYSHQDASKGFWTGLMMLKRGCLFCLVVSVPVFPCFIFLQ